MPLSATEDPREARGCAGADCHPSDQSAPIDVFFCNIAALHDSQFDPANLSIAERERARRFRFERDRRMFTCCRLALRELLASRTGMRAGSLQFELGAYGKPRLSGHRVSFNLSHAGDWFACAITDTGDIGIDIEHVHPLDDMYAMARHFFAPAEVQRLADIPANASTASFFECWTRKEAVIKATGEGLSRSLSSFQVAFGPDTPPALLRLDDRVNPGWHMSSFLPASQYVAALASPRIFDEVRVTFLVGG